MNVSDGGSQTSRQTATVGLSVVGVPPDICATLAASAADLSDRKAR
jgi:hypothetical protein